MGTFPSDGSAARSRHPADGGAPGAGAAERRALALRTEMGRLSLPRLPRRRAGRAALEIGAEPRTLLPRYRRGAEVPYGGELRARRRDRHPDPTPPVVRGVAVA